MIIAAILRDAENNLLFVNKWDTVLSLKHKVMCCFHGGGWLEIGAITVEVDIISPRAFVPTLKEGNSEADVRRGGYASHSGAASVVKPLWLRGEFAM